jgi:vancomycin permeability regulator SanA
MVVVVIGTAGVNVWMVQAAAGRIFNQVGEVPARSTGLVLGTETGSMEMEDRLDAAAELYKAGKVTKLLATGGSDGQGYDEARDMTAGLIQRGVPAAAITGDPMGYRTLDSMARARKVFGIGGVVIVSQQFHLPRAVFLAQHWGLDAVGYAAADPDRTISHSHVREWLARVLAVLDVWVLNRQPRVSGPPAPTAAPAAEAVPLTAAPGNVSNP